MSLPSPGRQFRRARELGLIWKFRERPVEPKVEKSPLHNMNVKQTIPENGIVAGSGSVEHRIPHPRVGPFHVPEQFKKHRVVGHVYLHSRCQISRTPLSKSPVIQSRATTTPPGRAVTSSGWRPSLTGRLI